MEGEVFDEFQEIAKRKKKKKRPIKVMTRRSEWECVGVTPHILTAAHYGNLQSMDVENGEQSIWCFSAEFASLGFVT